MTVMSPSPMNAPSIVSPSSTVRQITSATGQEEQVDFIVSLGCENGRGNSSIFHPRLTYTPTSPRRENTHLRTLNTEEPQYFQRRILALKTGPEKPGRYRWVRTQPARSCKQCSRSGPDRVYSNLRRSPLQCLRFIVRSSVGKQTDPPTALIRASSPCGGSRSVMIP